MKCSLMSKMISLFFGIAICLFIFLNTVGTSIVKETLLERAKKDLYQDATKFVSEYVLEYYKKSNPSYMELVKQVKLLDDMHGTRVWMVSNKGVIVTDSESYGVAFDLIQAKSNFLEQVFQEHIYFPEIMEEPMLCTILPVIYDYENKGYLVMSIPERDIAMESSSYTNVVNIYYFLFLPILFVLFFVVYHLTAVPVKKITKAIQQFLIGNFKEPLQLDDIAEYKELGQNIQYMGDKLQNLDDTQRKFVANVSHDFRSPLTSIKGYIEAMKDGTIPVEMQEKYLDIIIFETERLTKLTSNLLELNSFEDKGIILHKSEFDINQMIKQVAMSFEGTLKKKKLVLNLIFSQKEQLVQADMDKIQQVLYNLVDNAVKFSNSDSFIQITTKEKNNKVWIAVKDNGIGIPKDSIDKVWDRFYKTDLSRGKDKKGTGLGLAIVKEIIVAHEENISVVSTEGVGTEFVFSLPRIM